MYMPFGGNYYNLPTPENDLYQQVKKAIRSWIQRMAQNLKTKWTLAPMRWN
jgi:hypothetical protein